MASIDIITAAGQAYKKTWAERAYLLPMVAIPILIKYLCFSLSNMYVEDNNILRHGLIMVPAYFAEGWLLCHWARTVMMGHRWPFKPTGDDKKDLIQINERGRGILGGTITYLLIHLFIAGYIAFFMGYIPMDLNPQEADPKMAAIGAFMMVSTLLLFRFVWIYIALAVNITPQAFIRKVQPIKVTFQMIGIWLVCLVPTIMAAGLVDQLLFPAAEEASANRFTILNSISLFFSIIFDTIKNLLATAGIAYVLMMLFKKV